MTPLNAGDLAQIGSAGFAAIAAGASWASVAQNRRERRRGEIPDVHMGLITLIGPGQVLIHFTNFGGPAKQVKFCVVSRGSMAYGLLPPSGFLRAGEDRTLSTGLHSESVDDAFGVAWCYSVDGRTLHAWPTTRANRSWPTRGWRARRTPSSAEAIVQQFFPEVDFDGTPLASYRLTNPPSAPPGGGTVRG